jgi:hypothetical protein
MPPVGFQPIIPASERPQTHALDDLATGIGELYVIVSGKRVRGSEWYWTSSIDKVKYDVCYSPELVPSTPVATVCLLKLGLNFTLSFLHIL